MTIKFRTSRASSLKTSGHVIPKTNYLKELIDLMIILNTPQTIRP